MDNIKWDRDDQKSWDILGLGCTTVDDLLYVDQYPHPDAKVRVTKSERQCGGLTAIALIAASRLGASCAYGGALGSNRFSEYVKDALAAEKVDLKPMVSDDKYSPIHSTIIVDTKQHTRNIFYEIHGHAGPIIDAPAEDIIESSRVLFIDHYGVEGTIRAANIARTWGIPVVADIERDNVDHFYDLLQAVDHLVISERFASKISHCDKPYDAIMALKYDKQAVVVTCGDFGCWYIEEGMSEPQFYMAFNVDAVDTTGCGDVFHGAYAASLAWGWDIESRIRFASAAAAIKATRHGAQNGAPSRQEVDEFLSARG